MKSGWVSALKLLILVTMYCVTFFMRRLALWFEVDLFLLVLMSLYTAIFCGTGNKVIYLALTCAFFVRLVLEKNLSGVIVPLWYAFVTLASIVYFTSLLNSDK